MVFTICQYPRSPHGASPRANRPYQPALGFGTDQGKLGNVNGMGILAKHLGIGIGEVGSITFRPAYTPVSFGAIAGRNLGDLFDPVRKTAMHQWHVEYGAEFENVGQWKRPWYYPQPGEDLHRAVNRVVEVF